jgi:di/tricarboxylate transporter
VTIDAYITIAILALTFGLLIKTKLPPAAVFMFPIAMAMAGGLGLSFMPFAITVMVGASCSFISPMGYQTNLMVYGPGGYKFTDYVKMGVPLTVVVGIVSIILTPMFFGFQAP